MISNRYWGMVAAGLALIVAFAIFTSLTPRAQQTPCLAGQTTAIPVQNPSFEDFDLRFDGNFTVNGTGLTGFGWTVTGGQPVGVFRPGLIFFNEPVPDGVNVAFSRFATISQVLTEILAPNTTYTLEVGIGDQNNVPFGGYRVQLLAGGTLLAEDNNTLFPADGTSVTSTVTFNALPGDPNLGLPLEIRLVPLGFTNTSFDNVKLDCTRSVVPFADVTIIKAEIEFRAPASSNDSFEVEGEFTLGEGSDGIDPVTEEVLVIVGTSSITIPAGSFTEDDGKFEFEGDISGVDVKMEIEETDPGVFEFEIEADGVDLTDTTNPLDISAVIGDDTETANIRLEGELQFELDDEEVELEDRGVEDEDDDDDEEEDDEDDD